MKREEKQERIYEASLKLFAQYGFRKTAVRDIAAQLGMTQGNLYLYVKDKRDLYEQSIVYALLRWQDSVMTAVSSEEDVVKRFELVGMRAYEYLSRDEDLRQILARDPSLLPLSPSQEPFVRVKETTTSIIYTLLHTGIEQGRFRTVDLEVVTEFLFSIYRMFIIKRYVTADGPDMGRVFEEGFRLLILGLLVPDHPLNAPWFQPQETSPGDDSLEVMAQACRPGENQDSGI